MGGAYTQTTMQKGLMIMGNTDGMPVWMRDRLAKQARRPITWADRVHRVKEDESYLLLTCDDNGAYGEHIVTATKAPDREDLFELRERTTATSNRFIMYATSGGMLSPTTALDERPIAVLCTRHAYHQLNAVWGNTITTRTYTDIAYDTPAIGMVTVTTLFGTTITYPRERILGIA